MLKQTIRVNLNNTAITGKVIKVEGQNSDIIFVQSGNDTYKFFVGVNDIEVLTEKEIVETKLDSFLTDNNYDYEVCGSYIIKGYTYNVWLYVYDNGSIECSTVHKRRKFVEDSRTQEEKLCAGFDDEKSTANIKEVKTVKGAISYINKYANL